MESQRLLIPSSYSRIIARMLGLQERGLPALLAGTGLPVSILLPGDETLISGTQQVQVLANGHRLMRGPGFGLAMGAQLGPASHGPVGYLSLASPDLHSALQAYADFIPARLPLIDLQVSLSELEVSTLRVEPGGALAGAALGETDLRRLFGLSVVAIRRGDGMISNPGADTVVEPGDRLIVLGLSEEVNAASELFRAPQGCSDIR